MNEFEIIRTYLAPLATLPGADGLRDDVAEVAPGLIVTKDAMVEGIHFLADDPIRTVAQKLVRVNVSDVIAKGGKPDAALLALIWPKGRPAADIADFARGLGADLQKWGAYLVGGDTTSTDGPLTLSLTLLGRVGPRGPVRRSGARPGEDVWITGVIGDGWLGLQAARGELEPLIAEARSLLVSKYRIPSPPYLPLADLVASVASASIDVSDGLVADAGHIAESSGVQLMVESDSIPLSAVGRSYVENGKVGFASMITGGDDYQTLFTAPASARNAIELSKLDLTRIGRVIEGKGVQVLTSSGAPMHLPRTGWRHFSE